MVDRRSGAILGLPLRQVGSLWLDFDGLTGGDLLAIDPDDSAVAVDGVHVGQPSRVAISAAAVEPHDDSAGG